MRITWILSETTCFGNNFSLLRKIQNWRDSLPSHWRHSGTGGSHRDHQFLHPIDRGQKTAFSKYPRIRRNLQIFHWPLKGFEVLRSKIVPLEPSLGAFFEFLVAGVWSSSSEASHLQIEGCIYPLLLCIRRFQVPWSS